MKFQFSGDFLKVARFSEKCRTVPSTLEVIGRQLGEATVDLIREGFENSRAPDGTPWEPPKLRSGRPLEDTGGLKASFYVKSSGKAGFIVASAKRYAKYHQRGTGLFGPHKKRIKAKTAKALKLPGGLFRRSVAGAPKRRMIPEPGQDVPSWTETHKDVALEVLELHFRQRGSRKR